MPDLCALVFHFKCPDQPAECFSTLSPDVEIALRKDHNVSLAGVAARDVTLADIGLKQHPVLRSIESPTSTP